MDIEFALNVLDAILILGVAIPTLVIASRVKQRRLRLLTVLLTGFLVFHGLYHLTAVLGSVAGLGYLGTLSDLLIEPLGWVIFLAFAVFLSRYS